MLPEPRTTTADDSAESGDVQAPEAGVQAAAPEGAAQAGPGWKRALGTGLRVLESRQFKLAFVLAMVALGIYAVTSEWSEFKQGLGTIGPVAALEAFGFVLINLFLNMRVWRGLLAAAGSRLSNRAASRVFFLGQLGKYLPGSVWPVLAQMELGREYQVPRQRSATVAMLSMMIGLTSGLLAALIGLPFMGGGDSVGHYWWAFLFVPVLLVCLHPKVLNPAIAYGLRLMRKPAPETPLTGRAIFQGIAVNLAAWAAIGLQLWVMVARLGANGGHSVLMSIGLYAFAWSVGFLIVLAPAGAGAREAILIAALTPVLTGGYGAAVAVALVSRLVTVLGDLAGAGVAAGVGVSRGGRTAPEQPARP